MDCSAGATNRSSEGVRAPPPTICFEDFIHESRLADAGLAGDEQCAPPAGLRGLPTALLIA